MATNTVKCKTESITIRELLDSSAEKYAQNTFIKYVRGGKVIDKSYDNVREDSLAVCRYIRNISKGKLHIAIVGKTNYEYITALTGALLSGNVVVPLAYDMSVSETAALLKHSDSTMLFYDKTCDIEALCALCPDINAICLNKTVFSDIYENYSSTSEYSALSDFESDPDDCALIMYTSGTTGDKKGVMLSMRALISNTNFKELSFSPDDITLSVLPMHHIFCFSSDYLKNIKDGVTVCLNEDISNINANLLRFEPTIIRLVPVMTNSLLRKTRIIKSKYPNLSAREAAEAVFGRRIRWITSSGAYLSPEIINEFEEMGIKVRQAYGMTEAGPRISVPDSETSPQSVGRVISICDIRTMLGEIQISSPSIMQGYYKNPEATAQVITSDGWLRTGDIGYITDDRQLYITGRLKNLIILSNGENVSPERIEKKFASEPLIKEVLVYEKNDRIVADIYPDYSLAQSEGITDIAAAIDDIVREANTLDTAAHEVDTFNILTEPLMRTSSGKLIRKSVEISNK